MALINCHGLCQRLNLLLFGISAEGGCRGFEYLSDLRFSDSLLTHWFQMQTRSWQLLPEGHSVDPEVHRLGLRTIGPAEV